MEIDSEQYTKRFFFAVLIIFIAVCGCTTPKKVPTIHQAYSGDKLPSGNTALLLGRHSLTLKEIDGRKADIVFLGDYFYHGGWMEILPGPHRISVSIYYSYSTGMQRKTISGSAAPIDFEAKPHRIYVIEPNVSEVRTYWDPVVADRTEEVITGKYGFGIRYDWNNWHKEWMKAWYEGRRDFQYREFPAKTVSPK